MKFVLRYGLATLLIVIAVILIVPPFAASLIERWSRSDVESRSVLAFNSALDDFTTLLEEHNAKKIVALFDRMALDEQLLAVGFCDQTGALLYLYTVLSLRHFRLARWCSLSLREAAPKGR
jgi:trehalose 6-phosphate synthase